MCILVQLVCLKFKALGIYCLLAAFISVHVGLEWGENFYSMMCEFKRRHFEFALLGV
jgi:hypothetical protein